MYAAVCGTVDGCGTAEDAKEMDEFKVRREELIHSISLLFLKMSKDRLENWR